MEPDSFFHIALKVADLDESLAFYRTHLDAELLERGDAADGDGATAVNHAAMKIADKRVYLFDEAPYEAAGYVEALPLGFLHFGYVVDDIEANHRALSTAGVEFIMEPTVFGELKIAFFTTPSGVVIELLERL